MTNAFRIPTVKEELTCCGDTESVRDVSMAEQLDKTQERLNNAVAMLEQLDAYIFGAKPTEGLGMPHPECMRDAITNNEYLSDLVVTHLKELVDRICK